MNDWPNFEKFSDFIGKFNLRNFQPSELLIATSRPKNRPPAQKLWGNIVPTILLLDELRESINKSIVISSCYRAPEYNKTLSGSAKLSQHQAFTAVDFHVRGLTPIDCSKILKEWRESKLRLSSTIPIKRNLVKIKNDVIPQDDLNIQKKGDIWTFQFKGGIGVYNTFVHLDTRGINATWNVATKE